MYGDLVEWRKEGGCKAMWENEPTQNQKQIPIHDGNKDSLKWHLKACDFTRFVFPSRSISCANVLSNYECPVRDIKNRILQFPNLKC